ncbi:MAG: carboxypeptidase regulatory-like domain-containing protein, partial [Oscillospiraceae bacterium]
AATGATVNANDVTTIAVGTNGGNLAANVSSSAMANITASKQAITGVTSTAIPAKNNVNIAMTSGTVTVIGGKVMQYVNNNEVAASGTRVVITSKDGKTYTGYVDAKGDFAVPGVPAAGGKGYSVLFDDGNTKTARFENVTITPHAPADGYAATDITFPTKIMPPNVGEIIGVVDKNGNPVNGAVVTLYYGTQKLASQTTASDGKYKFTGINYGYYRMVVTYGSIEVTKIFELNGANKTLPISLPNGNENTVVEQKEKTPPTTADIPHTLFDTVTQDTAKGITQAEKDTLTNGGTIEIKLVAELRADTDAKEDRAKITDAIDTANGKIGLLLDLSVLKTVTDSNSTVLTNAQRLTELSDVLTIILELPQEYQGKTKELSLYRVHNGATEKMKTAGKEHYSFINVGGKDYIKVVASKFSSYALVSTKDNGPIIDSSSSSSSSNSSNNDDDIYLPPTAPSKPNKKPAKKPAPSSSSQVSSSSASSKPIEKEDTSKIDAKAKENLKANLKDMLDKAIAALSSNLTDEQRADAIVKLTAIYDKAIAKIDKATADEGKKIYDDAVEQMNAVSADSLSTNSTKKCKLCGKCTPFLGICIWVWIAILVVLVVAVITLFILYKRKKDNETAQNQEKIDRK